MGSHKKHKYHKKKSKKSMKKRKKSISLKEIRERLKNDKKYSDLISSLSIKDKKIGTDKRCRSHSTDSSDSDSKTGGGSRRKIKYKYKKSRSSSITSSSSSSSVVSSSSSSSSSHSSSSSSENEKNKRLLKHKKKKLKKDDKKKKIEILNKKYEETNKKLKTDDAKKKGDDSFTYDKKRIKKIKLSNECGPSVSDNVREKSKSMAPMSKEEWDKKQNEIKRVYDQETGRFRLIKGDGEVLEEIVSRTRHREINKQATLGDGNYFQAKLNTQLKK